MYLVSFDPTVLTLNLVKTLCALPINTHSTVYLKIADKTHVGEPKGLHRGIAATDGREQGEFELEWGRQVHCAAQPKQLVHKMRDLNLIFWLHSSRCLK